MNVDEFLGYMKKHVGPVPGIGHRVKSLRNPDKRVKELVGYVKSLNIKTPCLDFALQGEQVTADIPAAAADCVARGPCRCRSRGGVGRSVRGIFSKLRCNWKPVNADNDFDVVGADATSATSSSQQAD